MAPAQKGGLKIRPSANRAAAYAKQGRYDNAEPHKRALVIYEKGSNSIGSADAGANGVRALRRQAIVLDPDGGTRPSRSGPRRCKLY
jgi:hypothetical protein